MRILNIFSRIRATKIILTYMLVIFFVLHVSLQLFIELTYWHDIGILASDMIFLNSSNDSQSDIGVLRFVPVNHSNLQLRK